MNKRIVWPASGKIHLICISGPVCLILDITVKIKIKKSPKERIPWTIVPLNSVPFRQSYQ